MGANIGHVAYRDIQGHVACWTYGIQCILAMACKPYAYRTCSYMGILPCCWYARTYNSSMQLDICMLFVHRMAGIACKLGFSLLWLLVLGALAPLQVAFCLSV